MTPRERTTECLIRFFGFAPNDGDWENANYEYENDLLGLGRIIEEAIINAIIEERQCAANLAWEMQMEQFGGGTAIGNAISQGERAKNR